VAAKRLQLQHDRCQVSGLNFVSRGALADVIILAKLAAQVTTGEKDGARATPATQRVFFAEMRSITADPGSFTSPADTVFARPAIYSANPGAQAAPREHLVCL
jgi:hypothetical protein